MKTLAAVFAAISFAGVALESKADAVLAIVKKKGLKDLKAFDAAAKEAYAANGWNTRQGRPVLGAKDTRVPATVKQYVSRVRAAFRLGMNVGHFKTFHALRAAVKTAQAQNRRPKAANDPKLAGVAITKANVLIGAPFHDLTAIYESANKMQQRTIASEVQTLVKKFKPAAPQLTLAAAA